VKRIRRKKIHEQAIIPSALSSPPKLSYTYDEYAQELRERLRTNRIVKEKNLKEEKQKAKEYHDKKAKEIKLK